MEEIIIALAKASILVALNQPTDFNLTDARRCFMYSPKKLADTAQLSHLSKRF
jgi:hypothetical protein